MLSALKENAQYLEVTALITGNVLIVLKHGQLNLLLHCMLLMVRPHLCVVVKYQCQKGTNKRACVCMKRHAHKCVANSLLPTLCACLGCICMLSLLALTATSHYTHLPWRIHLRTHNCVGCEGGLVLPDVLRRSSCLGLHRQDGEDHQLGPQANLQVHFSRKACVGMDVSVPLLWPCTCVCTLRPSRTNKRMWRCAAGGNATSRQENLSPLPLLQVLLVHPHRL